MKAAGSHRAASDLTARTAASSLARCDRIRPYDAVREALARHLQWTGPRNAFGRTLGQGDAVKEAFDVAIRDYIDFVNEQVGVYMDALAGFAGHYTRVERQVHRISRPTRSTIDNTGQRVVVWASYEDPTQPDVIHNRIIRANDYLAANAKGGSNEQQHARAVVVFLFTYWEDEIRPRLAASKGTDVGNIRSDVLGDLREVRHAILHAKSVMHPAKHRKLKKLGALFAAGEPIRLSYETMHKIFAFIKQDCARMLFDWLGVKDGPVRPEEIVDFGIQNLPRRQPDKPR